MATLKGRTIQWNSDHTSFEILNYNPCPVLLGEPLQNMGIGVEWLADYIPYPAIALDQRVWVRIDVEQPTTIPHPQYPMYNTWQTTYDKEKRSLDLITASIQQEEQSANAALLAQAEEAKVTFFMAAYTLNVAKGITPSTEESNAEIRHADVTNKLAQNAARRNYLIAQFTAGEVLDISSGFERTVVIPGNEPFIE